MKNKTLFERKTISLSVAMDYHIIAFLPTIELYLDENYKGCGFLEFKWIIFGFAISFYKKGVR